MKACLTHLNALSRGSHLWPRPKRIAQSLIDIGWEGGVIEGPDEPVTMISGSGRSA
jgi:hypothetical protein